MTSKLLQVITYMFLASYKKNQFFFKYYVYLFFTYVLVCPLPYTYLQLSHEDWFQALAIILSHILHECRVLFV